MDRNPQDSQRTGTPYAEFLAGAAGMLFTIDGIPTTTSSEDLREVVFAITPVQWVTVVRDTLGRSLRFAIGQAADSDGVRKLVSTLDGERFGGLQIRVARLDDAALERTPRIRELIAAEHLHPLVA